MKIVNFPISGELRTIFELVDKDGSLRIVGGSVRDFLSNKEISDIDLACSFKPEKIKGILENGGIKVIETGIKHGTITAIINSKAFEITTLRKDVKTYGRKAKVQFIDNFFEDAQRRDFTINAMSIDARGNLFDYFGGYDDLQNKIVKFIGDPGSRIKEDYLRILRFFRFSCYYSNSFDQAALKAILELKDGIDSLSSTRIRAEFLKIINCPDNALLMKALTIMKDGKLLPKILLFDDTDLEFLRKLFSFFEKNNLNLKFAALAYSHKPNIAQILDHLDFSNKDKKFITTILNLSDKINLKLKIHDFYKYLFDFDKEMVINALKINIITSANTNGEINDEFIRIESLIQQFCPPKFIIDGNDLKQLGIEPKLIGINLTKLRNSWIDSDFKLGKKELLQSLN